MLLSLPLLLACAGDSSLDTAAEQTPPAGTLSIFTPLLEDGARGDTFLVVGPDGTTVLVDVGDDENAEEIAADLDGIAGGRTVDHVLVTHFHADHVGGWGALREAGLEIRGRVVSRGPFDLAEGGASKGGWEAFCEDLRGDLGAARVDLCEGPAEAPCDLDDGAGPWPASSCPAADPEVPFVLDLGEGATLRVLGADAFAGTRSGPSAGWDDDGENARSLVAVVTWGDFTFLFAGDLTGGGKDTPDLEGFFADAVSEAVLPGDTVDVVRLSHHGISSSTRAAWVDRFLPVTGQDRHAIVSTSDWSWSSPAQEVLDRVSPRLGAGSIWATTEGAAAGEDARLNVVGDVDLRVTDGGTTFEIGGERWPSAP